MILKTEKGEYHCHFYHKNISNRPRRVHMQTEVRLHPGPCKLEGPEGEKRCTIPGVRTVARQNSRLDVFDKRVGRIVALDRALRGLPETTVTGRVIWPKPLVPREVRAQLWKSYFEQAKLPKSRGSR